METFEYSVVKEIRGNGRDKEDKEDIEEEKKCKQASDQKISDDSYDSPYHKVRGILDEHDELSLEGSSDEDDMDVPGIEEGFLI